MAGQTHRTIARPTALIALILVQSLCVAIFLSDVVGDGLAERFAAATDWHFMVECVAVLGLIAAVGIEARMLWHLWHRKTHLEQQAEVAARALHDVIEAQFTSWGLTSSERDVALFTVKGCSISEIAELRGSAEGTVKSHLNGIYRKAGVGSRGELLSLLMDDLFSETIRPQAA